MLKTATEIIFRLLLFKVQKSISINIIIVIDISPDLLGIAPITATSFSILFLKTFRERRLADGLATENRCMDITGLVGSCLLFPFPGLDKQRLTKETKIMMLVSLLDVSQLNHIRDQKSRAGRSFTNYWGCNTLSTNPMLPRIIGCLLPQRTFLAKGLQTSNYGACPHSNTSPRTKLGALLNSIFGSNSSIQHADNCLRKEVSLNK